MTTDTHTRNQRRRRLALLCCLGAGFGTLVDASVITYTVPYLGSELQAETNGVQWFLAAYSLSFGLGLVPGGRLGDAYGRRGLFLLGLAVFVLGAVASGFAPTIWIAVAGQLVQGVGAGLISAQVLGIIQDEFAGTGRVRALALYSMAGAAAAILGPVASGIVLTALPDALAWRAVVLLSVPPVLVTVILAVFLRPAEQSRARRPDLDLPGIALLAAIVVLVTLPVIDPGVTGGVLVAVVAAVLLLLATLVLWERRYAGTGKTPLFVPALMRSNGFVAGNIVALLWFGAVVAHIGIVTIFLLQGQSLSPLLVAAVLVPSAVARLAASAFSSRLFARLGPASVTIGLAVQVVALAVLCLATVWLSGPTLLTVIVVTEIAAGLTAGLVEPPLRAITLGFAAHAVRGVAASFLQLTQRLSATFCVALATGLLLGTAGARPTEVGLRSGLLVCLSLLIVATIVSRLWLEPTHRPRAPR
ncbi:MFS transporter [Cryobacterium arcticum]|uniref:Transporter n=1 Tax=Cryobacterium arcticum TaxID=670052 RepID=A0A1B1BKY1_9MICO|nr:MFS transporter [Cryobacterium arcticum]ANP73154.1 Transporter [Cryobacterium arcticum]